MKKNIFSVLITALTVINVVLTAVMFFVMLPTFQKTNNLITQVASVLNLELNGDDDVNPDANYTIKDMQSIPVAFESDETYNLQAGTDGKAHYAMLSGYGIYLNLLTRMKSQPVSRSSSSYSRRRVSYTPAAVYRNTPRSTVSM